MESRNVLLLTYSFPPLGGIGVQRALSLAKYLPKHGFNVHVVTSKNAAAVVHDPKLTAHIPVNVSVDRVFTPDLPFHARKLLKNVLGKRTMGVAPTSGWKQHLTAPVKNLFCPDPQRFWAPLALRRATQIVRERSIDTVIVTAPPFSIFLASNELKRRFPYLTLVTDFRDEWLTYYFNTLGIINQNSYSRRRAAEIERSTVELSDRVVAVTSRALDEMKGRYPNQPSSKFQLIPNGFDPEVFAAFPPRPFPQGKVIVSYTGTIYPPSQPGPLVEALAALAPSVRDQLEIRIIGHIETPSDRTLLESQKPAIKLESFLPQNEVLKRIGETDYLLLIWHDEINIPGKLFEYLATGKPVLALAPANSEVRRLIEQTRGGWWADIHQVDQIRCLIETVCGVGGTSLASKFDADRTAIRRYERPRLAARYADLLSLNVPSASLLAY